MSQTELRELVAESRKGDRGAQERLVAAVQERVLCRCRKMLKNEDDALDATQDILLSMLSGLHSLREPAAFWGWLNQMTANTCLKKLSRSRHELPFSEDEAGRSLLESCETPDDEVLPDKALDHRETRRMIVELVDALPEVQRLCVLMYYYDEMPVKDIAAALETSEGTVKSRLNYARKSIRAGVDR